MKGIPERPVARANGVDEIQKFRKDIGECIKACDSTRDRVIAKNQRKRDRDRKVESFQLRSPFSVRASCLSEFALILERVLGTSAEMWVRIQAEYDLALARARRNLV